jgi:hypothetical protein
MGVRGCGQRNKHTHGNQPKKSFLNHGITSTTIVYSSGLKTRVQNIPRTRALLFISMVDG